jgi:hypothetical protein
LKGAFRDRHGRWERDAMDADGVRRDFSIALDENAAAYGEVVWF